MSRSAAARIVVTGGEYAAGLALLRAVRAGGDEPIAAVTHPTALAASSRSAHAVELVPEASREPARFVTELGAVARRHAAVAVLPGTEPVLRALAHHRRQLPEDLVVGCPPAEIVDRVLDKGALEEIAAAGGLRTPPTRVIDADRAREWDDGFPAVVKPVASHVQLADGTMQYQTVVSPADHDELVAALRALPGERGLVQPFLVGRQRTVDGLAWEGEVVAIAQKRGDRTWPRDCGVLSYGRIVVSDADLEHRCRQMIAELGWSGLFNLQFLEVPRGRFLIDFNPRAWNSLAVQVDAGANMPAAWVDLLLGRPVRPAVPRLGRRFRAEIEDARSLLAAWQEGNRMETVRGVLPRPGTSHAIFSWSDPLPALRRVQQGGFR